MLALMSLVVILGMVACDFTVEQEAVSFAKAELAKVAKQADVEVSHIDVTSFSLDVTPAEKANGVQARVNVDLRYAGRCRGEQAWKDSFGTAMVAKVNGQWEGGAAGFFGYGFPGCNR